MLTTYRISTGLFRQSNLRRNGDIVKRYWDILNLLTGKLQNIFPCLLIHRYGLYNMRVTALTKDLLSLYRYCIDQYGPPYPRLGAAMDVKAAILVIRAAKTRWNHT